MDEEDAHLERELAGFLRANRQRHSRTVESEERKEQNSDNARMSHALQWKFDQCRENAHSVTFDAISEKLNPFFMARISELDIDTGNPKWRISFAEIATVYPNAKELRFLNRYKLDEYVLRRLVNHLRG